MHKLIAISDVFNESSKLFSFLDFFKKNMCMLAISVCCLNIKNTDVITRNV